MDKFLAAALNEARNSSKENGIPIGAVLVLDGKIISRGHNRRVQDSDPILHAEIDCLRNAGRIGDYSGTTLYSTLMPCYLCAGAIVQFGIRKVVVGESYNFEGARAFLKEHGVKVANLRSKECKQVMSAFISEKPELWHEDIGQPPSIPSHPHVRHGQTVTSG